jgi:hypothetical protein
MLDRRRRRSDLKLGVRRNPGFEAHAWLEVDGAIVIGEHRDGSGYEPMPRVSPRSEVPRNGVPRN